MAECDGDGIRRIIWFRDRLQGQDAAHISHNLLFVRAAVTNDCLLDLQRRVFIDLQPGLVAESRMMPRPWATAMPVVIFVLKNSSSTAITSGWNCAMSSFRSR